MINTSAFVIAFLGGEGEERSLDASGDRGARRSLGKAGCDYDDADLSLLELFVTHDTKDDLGTLVDRFINNLGRFLDLHDTQVV